MEPGQLSMASVLVLDENNTSQTFAFTVLGEHRTDIFFVDKMVSFISTIQEAEDSVA